MPIEVELSSLQVLQQSEENSKDKFKQCILDLEKLELIREATIEHYARQADRRRCKFNKKLATKEIKVGSLVL